MINLSGHNYSSMALAVSSIENKIDTSIQRLSSGQSINAAKDDVAGMQISMRLNADIKGLEQASKNAADVQSLIDTAEGSMKESTSILLRVRELAVQSANGTISEQDRAVLDDVWISLTPLLMDVTAQDVMASLAPTQLDVKPV